MAKSGIVGGLMTVGTEKLTMVFLQFISTIIMARLLTPEDYGTVAMLAIFISVAGTLIDSGFSGALIYIKDTDKRDYSTVFWLNIAISIVLYLLMFFSADAIADFYGVECLSQLIKILALAPVFNSLGLVQKSMMFKRLEFRKMAYISITSYFVASLTAILLAFYGFGVWALIALQVLQSLITTLIVCIVNRFIPDFYFSDQLLKKHWNFGGGLFFSNLIKLVYDNMYLQLIGKYCSITNAGYYNQANRLKDIPTEVFYRTFDTVLFPTFSRIEDNVEFNEKYRLVNRILAYICVPVFFLLSLLSRDIILFLLGEKWVESAWILSCISIGSIFYVFEIVNRSVLKAKGLSKLIFKIEVVKRSISLVIMFFAVLQFELYGIVFAFIFNSLLGWYVNAIYIRKYCHSRLSEQVWDIFKYIFYSVTFFIIIKIIIHYIQLPEGLAVISVWGILFIFMYIVSSIMLKDSSYIYLSSLIRKKKL